MEVTGLDHLYITVSDFERSERFYDGVLGAFGFRKGDKPIGGDPHAHYFNRWLQYTIRPARQTVAHSPYAPGLHHVCFQVPARADVDDAARRLRDLGVAATAPAEYTEYSPDYYAVFFSDPDGIRLEVVARTAHRDEIVELWDRLEHFLNPVARLTAGD